jgi:alanine racemase
VDLAALRANYRALRARAGGAEILPVVKADGYGHGLVPVSRALVSAGARTLAVAYVREGADLRRAGLKADILVLTPTLPAEVPTALRLGLVLQVSTLSGARSLSRTARRLRTRARVHVKVDTGMGRVGFRPEQSLADLLSLFRLEGLRLEGFYTHLATADWADPAYARRQALLFKRVLEATGQEVGHVANSAALLTGMESARGTWARPGLALYGVLPSPRLAGKVSLRPVMQFKCRVIQVKTIGPGESVSYNRTFIAKRPTRVATLAAGYADGVNRHLSNRGHALVRGRRVPLIGNVCMDMTLADVTAVPGVREGDTAVLWGRDGKAVLGVGEQASDAGTIAYELLCGVGRRVTRVYRG